MDEDGVADAKIVDPSGPAVPTAYADKELAATGRTVIYSLLAGSFLLIAGSYLLVVARRRPA